VELRKLQATAQQVLERRRQVKELLEKARQQRQKLDHQAALQTAEELLSVEPEQIEALEMKRLATEALKHRRRIDELLAAARAHEQEQDYEACYRVSTEGLALDSSNRELKQLQERAHLALEKIHKVRELLQRAIQQQHKKDYRAILETTEELLAIEPQHAEAERMKQHAAEVLERQRKVEELRIAAFAHMQAQEYEACIRVATEGLGLDPGNGEFKRLQEQAQQAVAKRQKAQELVERARQQGQRQDYQGVLRTIEELLTLVPGHAEALQLKQQAEVLERQKQMGERLAAARAHAQAGEHEDCYRLATEGLGLDPENLEFKRLQEQSRQALAKRRKVEELLQRAGQQQQSEGPQAVLRTVEELLALEPGNTKASELKQSATEGLRRQQRVRELLAVGRAHLQAKEYEAAHLVATEGLTLDARSQELRKLQAEAQQALAKREKVQQLVEKARGQWQQQNYPAVLHSVEELLKVEPGQKEALELKRQAGEALERGRKVKEMLAVARSHAQAEEYEACYRVSSEGLGLDPRNVELGKLQASAHKILEQRRLEKEQRAVLARLWTSARNDMEKHRFKPAYHTLRQMLELEPGNSEALALRQQAETALAAKRQKIRRVLPIAAGLLLAVAIGVGGLLTYRGRKGAGPSSPSAEGKSQAPVSIEVPLPPVATQSVRDPKIAQGLEMASNYLKTKKYSEAAREAKAVLELSPGNSEAESLFRRAQENLDEIAAANRQAKSLIAAGKFEEAITSLSAVLKLAPSDPEARKLLKELDRYARKGADEAMTQSKLARAASEAARAPDLVRNLFDAARGIESAAMALYKAKQFGQATAKFSESREGYQHAATEARSRIETEQQRQQAAQQEQTLKVEREHKVLAQQQASQREAVQNARQAYDHARDKASQAGAETRALERFQQATGLASQAQAKRDRGDLQGARQDFEMAASAMELAATTAETLARQSQIELAGRVKDTAQKETDRQGVEQILKSYKAAWESKDLDRLKTLWPGLGGGKEKKIKQTFEFSRSIKIDLQPTNIHIAGNAATVTCQRQDQTVTVKGDKFSSKPFNTTLTLRRAGGTWVIDDVRLADE